jgi:hypothetical protein
MLMIAPIINTIPMILKTESAVSEVLLIALSVLALLFGMLSMVTKNANTPTAKIMSDTTTPMIAPGSIKPNLDFMFRPPLFYKDSYVRGGYIRVIR